MESESSGCSGWLTEFTNLPPLDIKRRLRRNWSVSGFRKRGMPFHQKWSLPLFWSVASQTIWMDQKMNWFTIQPRTLMNLMIQASKTYLNQTLSQNLKVSLFRNALFKDTEHFTWYPRLALGFFLLGWVVQSCVKITQGKSETWIQIWKLKTRFNLISLRLQVDDGKI